MNHSVIGCKIRIDIEQNSNNISGVCLCGIVTVCCRVRAVMLFDTSNNTLSIIYVFIKY